MKKKSLARRLESAYIIAVLFFLYAPIFVLIAFSFNETRSGAVWGGGFTLKWYAALLEDHSIRSALGYTLSVAVLATVISTAAGTISAIAIHLMGEKTRGALLYANYMPVINPDIVTGVSLMIVFNAVMPRLGYATLLISHITFCVPYVVLSVLPKLKQMDPRLLEAAMDLGAKPWYTLRRVVLPQAKPGILTGALLAFTLSIDDFVISFFTTGSGVSSLSIYVYSSAKHGISPKVNALSTIMILTVTTLLFIVNLRAGRDAQKQKQ